MPRIRTVKPEFWTAGQVLECSTNARLLFIGLWNFCDDAGRHPMREKQIKAEVFPADDFTVDDITGMLDELSANDLITPYLVDGKGYFQVNGWHHQRIDKPQDPKYPGMDQADSGNDRGILPPDRIGKEGKGKEGIVEEGGAPVGASPDVDSSTPEAKYSIPLTGGKSHPVTEDDISRYRELYPSIDVEQSIRNMLGWLEANPKRLSGSVRGVKSRMTTWFSGDQDRASRRPGGGQPDESPHQRAAREAREYRERRQVGGGT